MTLIYNEDMYELYPYFTNDGSTGLFSPDADDIYHSTYGALSEAYEKFILPANLDLYFQNKKDIKILDICFGIGYNTKSFLNYFLENSEKKFSNKNTYLATIDTNNICSNKNKELIDKCDNCNDEIYTNKNLYNIFIHAVDTDKNLMFLSPFFKTNEKNIKNEKLSFKQDKISNLLNKKHNAKYKINKETNIILLKNIIKENNEIFNDKEFLKLLENKKYHRYFDKYMLDLFDFYKNEGYNKTYLKKLNTFLHNIYYKYLSRSYKRAQKHLILNNINIKTDIKDARKALIESDYSYDIVFLDAFTPSKCPCLWTLDYFKEIYKHLDENGIVLTYSNSANIRNAFLQAGFSVGKIYNKFLDKYTGTAAVKNNKLFLNNDYISELTEYDLGLINTKAGIVYRDKNLTLANEAIIESHKNSVENSLLMSSSRYIKENKRNKCK